MKRLFAVLLASLIICLTFCAVIPSVSAAEDDWVLAPYAEYLTHNGKRYYKLDPSTTLTIGGYYYNNDDPAVYEKLKFADEKTKEKYDDSAVTIYNGAEDVAVEVELYDNFNYTGYADYLMYVEESHLQEYEAIAQGTANTYLIYNNYDLNPMKITQKEYTEWLNGTAVTMDAEKLDYYDWYYIYACDDLTLFEADCGMILYDYYLDNMYLLNYSDYDSSYFYSDGEFNTDIDKEVTVYSLEDENLKNKIVTFISTPPEDDLDWLVTEEVSEKVALVFCSIVFGALPLAALGFSVVMLFILKDKKYLRPYAIIAIGSLLVILAFVSVLLILI